MQLPAGDRAELAAAFSALAKAIGAGTTALRGKFRPSRLATASFLMELVSALSGDVNLIAKAKRIGPKIGPHVAALVQAL